MSGFMAAPLDVWKRKFETLAQSDKVGNVLLESLKTLNLLSQAPLSFIDLEYAADSINASISLTKKYDERQAQPKTPKEIALRECCFGMAEIVEFVVQALVANNQEQNILPISEPVDTANMIGTVKVEENAELDVLPIQNTTVDAFHDEMMDDVKPESLLPPFDLTAIYAMMPEEERQRVYEEEREEEEKEEDVKNVFPIVNPITYCDPPAPITLPRQGASRPMPLTSVDEPGCSYVKAVSSAETIARPSTSRQLPCSQCGSFFPNSYELERHEVTHLGRYKYKCEVCSKGFERRMMLKRHYDTDHPMPDCGAGAPPAKPSSGTVKKLFQCTYCPKNFLKLKHFKNHERIHTGERPFKCELCAKTFVQKVNLTVHVKNTHAASQAPTYRHPCQHCTLTFQNRVDLSMHLMKNHSSYTN
ncbi:hypothetical protein PFISCL1PPCAC_7230 [Pristionchus fissidentatus]|uniref:C2H2-type domain-containing protein n=1 Tax=Pristionchus fissidentatus TaxID=1538716 RepID=A0AAV5V9N0_9BILA|nr:hypothetical protein PFISCL1PPCAC_7230 [Pristionchus fissidentatus]